MTARIYLYPKDTYLRIQHISKSICLSFMVSFVYFDVGGVVVLDFSSTDKWEQLKKELSITKNNDAESESFWDKYEPRVNAG